MTHSTRLALAGLLTVLPALTGCGQRLNQVLLPAGRPEIRLERIRITASTPDTDSYLARWVGHPSGRPISHYLYAVDPKSVDAVDGTWLRTTQTQHVLAFPRAERGSPDREPHVFVVRAVDDQGAMSDPEWFAVAGTNLPPIVQITQPTPNPLFTTLVPPTVRIHWAGTDPDGQSTQLPVRYKYRLFGTANPDFPAIPDFIAFALAQPDSLRSLYAPGFSSWDSVPGESTSVEYSNLIPASQYLFAITAFDEAGDYDPIFSASKNLLRMGVVFPGTAGPRLTMYNEVFNYTYPSGGWINDASRQVAVEMPAGRPVTVNWIAAPPPGSDIHWYRWVLAPVDLLDETPRVDEATDWHHWSARSLQTTSATIGPFDPPPGRVLSQLLYIEAQDTNGLRSLGIVEIIVRRPAFTSELLFVDDTRLRPDLAVIGAPGQVQPPAGPWPTAAELDTFLFAKGGFPWKSYPAGTLSPPGIFNGYACDTIGTRGLLGGVPLSLLSRYRHVVWYTDQIGASTTGPPDDQLAPISELRRMSAPGQVSALAAYVQQGGRLWLCGGGAAYATLAAWNKPGTSPNEYDSREPNPELRPGRFMYDLAHWREGIQMLPAGTARRFDTRTGGLGQGDNRPGRHWPPNPPPPTPPAPPDYSLLPADLQPKTLATDPPPPLRSADTFWLFGSYGAEYIHRSTFIREDYDDDPGVVEEYSTLDTLYLTRGGTALLNGPVMTYYHGRENPPLVFSGFNFWYWRRSQCIALVDWVLQSVWGLERDAGAPREPVVARAAAAPAARMAARARAGVVRAGP